MSNIDTCACELLRSAVLKHTYYNQILRWVALYSVMTCDIVCSFVFYIVMSRSLKISSPMAGFHVTSYSPRWWTNTIDSQSDTFVLSTCTEVMFFAIAISRDRSKTTNCLSLHHDSLPDICGKILILKPL